MTTAAFLYMQPLANGPKPWSKVDGGGTSFELEQHDRPVENIRGQEGNFGVDVSGFMTYRAPADEKEFTNDANVRKGYYAEVENLVKSKLAGVKKVVVFDHTIRRRTSDSPRRPVQQVHVDQTQKAAETRVRRHLPAEEAEQLIKGRYQIVNVWRPIGNPASDFPLAVIDWRTTKPSDFVATDLFYPVRDDNDPDDTGKEVAPRPGGATEGYEVKGETFNVVFNPTHQFYYVKDMTPDEVLFLKCFDSHGQGIEGGKEGIAVGTPHTAFADPNTPKDAPPRQSIEARCLVFYD